MHPGTVLWCCYSPGFTHQVLHTSGIASAADLNCLKISWVLSPGSLVLPWFPTLPLPTATSRILSQSKKALEHGEFSGKSGTPHCHWVRRDSFIPLCSSVLIAIVWLFHRKPPFLVKIVPQRIAEAGVQQWETKIAWLGLTLGPGSSPLHVFWFMKSHSRREG